MKKMYLFLLILLISSCTSIYFTNPYPFDLKENHIADFKDKFGTYSNEEMSFTLSDTNLAAILPLGFLNMQAGVNLPITESDTSHLFYWSSKNSGYYNMKVPLGLDIGIGDILSAKGLDSTERREKEKEMKEQITGEAWLFAYFEFSGDTLRLWKFDGDYQDEYDEIIEKCENKVVTKEGIFIETVEEVVLNPSEKEMKSVIGELKKLSPEILLKK
jgi:hypothetical protein